MKQTRKSVLLLLVMLASCMLLSACDLTEISFEAQSQNELVPSTAEQSTVTPETTIITETADVWETETQASPEESQTTETRVQLPDEFEDCGLSKYLIMELMDYLRNYNVMYDKDEVTFADIIDRAKTEKVQTWHVKFDANQYYYACAYYNPTHEYPEYESRSFCCANEYQTWVRYDNPEQIAESYNGMQLVCAFQINKALFVRDIEPTRGLSDSMEHFKLYTPVFENGINIAACEPFDSSFIYLNDSNYETVYQTTDIHSYHLLWSAFPMIELEEQFYLAYFLYDEYPDGTISEAKYLDLEFGAYYDQVMRIIITDKYHKQDQSGRKTYYGLISVEDISSILNQ